MTDYNLDVLIQMILDRSEKNKVVKGLDDVEKNTKDIDKANKEATKSSMMMARNISKNARLMSKELGELRESAGWIKRGAMPLFQMGIAGFAAIALSARSYINNTKESNEITLRWAAATEKITAAQMRIGKISAEAILPLLEKAASIAEKTAAFVEKHPGIIEGGLKASIVAAGLGGIGLLVSKGITLYADIKMIAVGNMQLAAAKIMADASNKQLAAATGMKVPGAPVVGGIPSKGAGGPAGTAALAAAPSLGLTVAAAAGFTAVSVGMVKVIDASGELAYRLTGSAGAANQFVSMIKAIINILPGFSLVRPMMDIRDTLFGNAAAAQANAQAANNSSNANRQAANSMQQAGSASLSASNNLRQIPSALSGLGASIGNFFSNIIARLTGGAPTHDYTGYAYKGMYAMAQNNQRQFVLSGQATRLAEQMLGGQLNQQAVLASMGGGRGGVNIYDSSTYAAGVGARERRAMRQERLSEYEEIFG